MKKLIFILLVVANVYAATGFNTIFYQPLNKDINVFDWDKIFKQLNEKKINRLILQWTKHNETNFYTAYPQWFENLFKKAKQHDIDIIVGLYADTSYFKKISNDDVESFLLDLVDENINTAESLYPFLEKQSNFAGWYLYDEIDDKNWQKKFKQKELKLYLGRMYTFLKLKTDKEIYISGFFSGKMNPKSYVDMWNFIANEKFTVLLQNGVGAKNNTTDEALIYYEIFDKNIKTSWHPVIELFEIRGAKFYTLSEEEINKQIKALPQGKIPMAFSLRYFID